MSGGYNKSIYVPPEKVARDFGVSLDEIKAVIKKYPMRVTTHYYSLIEEVGDPIWKQCIPDIKELYDPYGEEDPLKEERDSPIPWLTHRYPDRLLMCVSNECATYCRFCTRKRRIGDLCKISDRVLIEQINYVKEHREVRDVLISGGDPFM
ncbi:MAG: hypothetical protein N3F06_03870, partial [Nitrososphaerales archaeon]|nr:hypothetical protein [Nitrososphaerales archaeon]